MCSVVYTGYCEWILSPITVSAMENFSCQHTMENVGLLVSISSKAVPPHVFVRRVYRFCQPMHDEGGWLGEEVNFIFGASSFHQQGGTF